MWLCSGEFRGCEIEFVVVRAWVCGVVVSVGLWVCGGVVSVGLWVCGGWPVGAWWWLVVGLWRWGCGFGIMDVGLLGCGFEIMEVWLRVWDCGGGALGLCCGFASDKRVENSPNGFASDEREE